MSQQQINAVTLAALTEWQNSTTKLSFAAYVRIRKAQGAFWGADETLEDGINVE